jgi:hypothetical protein
MWLGLVVDAVVDFVVNWWVWFRDPPIKRNRP